MLSSLFFIRVRVKMFFGCITSLISASGRPGSIHNDLQLVTKWYTPTHSLHKGEGVIAEGSELVDSVELHDAFEGVGRVVKLCGRERDNLQLRMSWMC